MVDILIILIVLGIVAGAGAYIYKAKKSGQKCIGCPDSGKCGAAGCSGCSCGCGKTN